MDKKVSVIINNYNYAAFLGKAIDSVLSQTHAPHEIIVVDDGSVDSSKKIIRSYHDKIIPVEKQNGGQASAFNAGYKVATGDWIWFLDSDDWLEKDAVEKIQNPVPNGCSKIHGSLLAVNEKGEFLNYSVPANSLSKGNVVNELIEFGGYSWPPTSGNIFPRWVLDKCMPVPEDEYRLCADLYICNWAAVLGEIHAVKDPLGCYRIHSSNRFQGFKMDPKWLDNQAKNLLTGASLTEKLIREHTNTKEFQYNYSRRSLEMLMIAKRFSNSETTSELSKKELKQQWSSLKEVRDLKGVSKIKANIFWLIIANAPSFIAQWVIGIGVKKNAKALQSSLQPGK